MLIMSKRRKRATFKIKIEKRNFYYFKLSLEVIISVLKFDENFTPNAGTTISYG
jgi:hypothetical protein